MIELICKEKNRRTDGKEMGNLVIQIILFFLIGAIIGFFGTLLFFRLDQGWKQILLGAGSALSAGGAGYMFITYLNISQENISLLLLVLVLGLVISIFFAFSRLCTLLKNQSGKNVIRILDIVLGYDGFLKDYYESRKKDIDRDLDLEELEKRKVELEGKEKYLLELQRRIQEQKGDSLRLELPEHSEVPLTNSFIRKIPLYVNHVCQFRSNVDKLTADFCEKFTKDKQYNAECLKGYFVGIGMYVANDLFGTANADVRTHFRILQNENYVQYTVVLGNKISDDKLTDIPKGKSMIDKSFELKKSLVASLNPESNYDTKTKWEDFMTITYYNLDKDGEPFLSMGISIKYAEQFREMLYFLNYYQIEECLHVYVKRINDVCNIVQTLQ